ncbi:MAG: histidine--tRNA ligase [Chloroflexi bacterium]|nr:histidine--tRNA ligase [Chloroflexota bacterium]MBM3153945.1 histidine--tRNA ligase [Chloroflexota bacterium]MBM3172295.1 histidine--tRNA ligase [Chloroflexota bacterium]MBM3174765.1 histidine--tRNA ligase [Chloroflexota bacterium]MBM4450116.1 histidine--tRNA ligase [Chloroflexota bacterium]
MYKAPRGTADILPEEQAYWRYVESQATALCRLYGYQRLDTPAFEDASLFTRSIGESTDIVTKEMYVFEDRSHNKLALRPEGTAPVCRAYLEHGLGNLPQPVKLYYFAGIFRYERPQAGRYRQHYQFGFEAIGEADPALDAEVIDMAWQFFKSLWLNDLYLYINSIGCRKCRPAYLKSLKSYYSKHVAGLCKDCQTRFEKNTLRLLDCKQPTCQEAAESAPRSAESLCLECGEHFTTVKKYLDSLGLPYQVNHRLVRGLDYYTKTVFEIQPHGEGSQSALGGGGRYDDLIEELGGKPTPAIGFASGMERVVLNLKQQRVAVPDAQKTEVFIACMGEQAKREGVKLAATLRRQGIAVAGALSDRSLKAQLRQADSLGSRFVVIIGDDEVKAGSVTLRDMGKGDQRSVAMEELGKTLEDILRCAQE